MNELKGCTNDQSQSNCMGNSVPTLPYSILLYYIIVPTISVFQVAFYYLLNMIYFTFTETNKIPLHFN